MAEAGEVPVLRTRETLPGAIRGEGRYHEAIEASRGLTLKDWKEFFGGSAVCLIKGERNDIHVVRRPEFDADPAFDHMLVALPNREGSKTHESFMSLASSHPRDAALMVDVAFTLLRTYSSGVDYGLENCMDVMGVLNTSPYDLGVTVREGIEEKERLPQSLMNPHIKCFGYPTGSLRREVAGDKEKELIHRPLQKEMDAIVAYQAKKLGLELMEDEKPALAVVIGYNDREKFVELYERVFESMELVSGWALGFISVYVGGGTKSSSKLRVRQKEGFIGESLRVQGDEAIKNIKEALLHTKEGVWDFMDGFFNNDPEMKRLITDYLKGMEKYIFKKKNFGEPVTLIYGPSFSVLLEYSPIAGEREEIVRFVPADFVRKGANTITGIFPKESIRPPTEEEKSRILSGNELVRWAFVNEYRGKERGKRWGGKFMYGDFNESKYFSRFS